MSDVLWVVVYLITTGEGSETFDALFVDEASATEHCERKQRREDEENGYRDHKAFFMVQRYTRDLG